MKPGGRYLVDGLLTGVEISGRGAVAVTSEAEAPGAEAELTIRVVVDEALFRGLVDSMQDVDTAKIGVLLPEGVAARDARNVFRSVAAEVRRLLERFDDDEPSSPGGEA